MLPRSYRLPSSSIRTVLSKGIRAQVPGLQIVYLKTKGSTLRFCVVAGVGFDRRATLRNRSKRLVWESLRTMVSVIPKGFDAVFFVRKGLPDVQADVQILLRKLLLLLSAER